MVNEFDTTTSTTSETASTLDSPINLDPIVVTQDPTPKYLTVNVKHCRPKNKKAAKKALRKAERERDQLLYANGRLDLENEMLKRAFALAISAKRRQLDDDLAENALRVLPPHRKDRG